MQILRRYSIYVIFALVQPLLGQSQSASNVSEPGAPVTEWYTNPVIGKATYYGNYQGGGACGLDQPGGGLWPAEIKDIDFTVAVDQSQFDMGSCGMCIELTGRGVGGGANPVNGTYIVYANNLCPECEWGHLDFALPGDGKWDIAWKAIPCNVGNDSIRWAFTGSNEYFLKLTTLASRFPTKSLRLKLDGEWYDGKSSNGGWFEFNGGGPYQFPIDVEVTSIYDEVLNDTIQSIQGGVSAIQYQTGFNGYVEPGDEVDAPALPGSGSGGPSTYPGPVTPGGIWGGGGFGGGGFPFVTVENGTTMNNGTATNTTTTNTPTTYTKTENEGEEQETESDEEEEEEETETEAAAPAADREEGQDDAPKQGLLRRHR